MDAAGFIYLMINLYDHQAELISSLRQQMGRYKRVLMQSATGSGKSIMATSMIYGSQIKNKRSHFVVPRRELIRQMHEHFNEFNIPHSFIAAGHSMNPHALTHIGSLSSMKGRVEKLPAPHVAFIDEEHYGGAVVEYLKQYYYSVGAWVIGLSATPKPGKFYDAMVGGRNIKWLMQNKFLSEYRLFCANFPDLSDIKVNHGEYAQKQLSDKMFQDDKIIGDAVAHYAKHAMGKLNLVFATDKRHNEKICARFNAAGISSAVLDSETPEKNRIKIIQAYARREILNLCTVDICTFGFDLAANARMDVTVESMSDLAPTMSMNKQLQKWGRVLRKKPYPALIFDHVGNSMKSPHLAKHGLPDWEREWELRDNDKSMRSGGPRAQPVHVCEFCYFAFNPSLGCCPDCKKEPTVKYNGIKEVGGELKEVDVLQIKRTLTKQQRMAMCKTLDDLFALANKEDYKIAWILKYGKIKKILEQAVDYQDIRKSYIEWRNRTGLARGVEIIA